MQTAIVIPCLDEEASLMRTCLSLGFHADAAPSQTMLILVDNGSTDNTMAVMREIRRRHMSVVLVGQMLERGYVPPRHLGVLLAKAFADEHGLANEEILILQADADTVYDNNYLPTMKAAAIAAPQDLIEGVARADDAFLGAYPGYHDCCALADTAVSRFAVAEAEEVVIDDKVAGYRLSEYVRWGGHRREFNAQGDEIHAETSRLFIRAKTLGAGRTRAGDAFAYPSRRKILADPLAAFASCGFPREQAWRARWATDHPAGLPLDAFDCAHPATDLVGAVFVRQVHFLILYALLPIRVQLALGRCDGASVLRSPLGRLLEEVSIDAEALRTQPGRLFEAFFALADLRPQLFADCISQGPLPPSSTIAWAI
ncbi:MAG: glycosyltransferase [Hyphomicrobiales bacterium]|nr:MAG: glycosyltransferase [Hyphomicrobiales bacterium]